MSGKLVLMGYKTIKINGKKVLEHRYVMEQFLGRKLKSCEFVHHIDNNPQNNAIENLMLTDIHEHRKLPHTWHEKKCQAEAEERERDRRARMLKLEKEQLICAKEAAKILGVSVGRLAVWRVQHKNLVWYKLGRLVRYKLQDIKDFVQNSKIKK
jgi:hypothetical protein